MTDLKFRPLAAEEVEVRVATCNERGVSLLLYKDARCDMNLLDEVVGPMNWDCHYDVLGGVLYCTVGIFDDNGSYRSKQDCGTPSNMEPEKGNASDAFKRACFKWGIGRELYTAPFIWVPSELVHITQGKNGKPACYDRFEVTDMKVEDGEITNLRIANSKTGKEVWPRDGQRIEQQDSDINAARKKLKAAIIHWAEVNGMDANGAMNGISKRPDYEQTVEFFERVAQEFEDAANE